MTLRSLARDIAEARDARRPRTMSPFERLVLDELNRPGRSVPDTILDMRAPAVAADPTRSKRKVRRS